MERKAHHILDHMDANLKYYMFLSASACLCLSFFLFFPGCVSMPLGAFGCQVVLLVVIFGHLFGHLLAPLGSRWVPLGAPVACPWAPFGTPFVAWCHLWSFLLTFLDTFWHPWGQGGSPGAPAASPWAPLAPLLWPLETKSGQKFGFVAFVKMSVFSW